MADEEVVTLLKEIRDLQKSHIENYREALDNQKIALDLQKRATRRQAFTLLGYTLIVVAVIVWLAWSSQK